MAAVATRSAGRRGIGNPGAIKHRSVATSTDTRLSWLSTCKSADLQRVANAIGSNTGGTKAVLCSRLIRDLQQNHFAVNQGVQGGSTNEPEQRIVSIDMGIRNLAYCKVKIPNMGHSCTRPPVPIVYEWARVAVSNQTTTDAVLADTVHSPPKEAFDPATYAHHAYRLIDQILSVTQPTQILLERQRFRSMGGSAVQEWTLRVNMFEAMLYAVLHTFSSRNLWHGMVHSVLPAKVSRFWLVDGEDKLTKKSHATSSTTKAAKIALAGKWIGEGGQFRLDGEAAKLAVAYQRKRLGRKQVLLEHDQRKGHPAGDYGPVEIGKLDDLADCLLQGMAWIQWERNRRRILAHGLHALEH